MQLIDLSVNVEPNPSEPMPIKIKINPHEGGSKFGRRIIFLGKKKMGDKIKALINYLNGKERITRNSFPDGEFINEETVTLSVHTGTHLDSPWHFGTTCEGKKSRSIDQIPLEWCFNDGVVLDFSQKKPGAEITKDDLIAGLNRVQYQLKPFDIVLIRTDTDKKWGTPRYFFEAPGLSKDGIEYLLECGVKIVGTDCYSLDRPFMVMLKAYFKTKDKKYLWPVHFFGRKKEYCHIERLCNLDKLPEPFGFKVACFPIKLKGLGAAWIRAVAILGNKKKEE
jgi:kynurenine formamidase